jgi:small subunit ribosomal protein S16
MAVKIRLRRVGRKKQPSYRMVVIDSEHPRGGVYLDTVGYYNPQKQPANLQIDLSKIDEWIGRGATMTETTESLVKKARRGGDKTVSVSGMPTGSQVEAPAAEEAEAATEEAEAATE